MIDPEEVQGVIDLLDHEFVISRGRTISLRERYPNLFWADNIQIIKHNRVVVSIIITKPFSMGGEQGTMIGMVYTRPEYRSNGFASYLLRQVHGPSVLFAKQWDIYWHLGWNTHDTGIFGEVNGNVSGIPNQPLTDEFIQWIDGINKIWKPQRLERRDYRVIPLPCTQVDAYAWVADINRVGYAIVGRYGTSGYVYEMVGHPDTFAALWKQLPYSKLYVNDEKNSLSAKWLTEHTNIQWKDQELAMWKDMEPRYIPYLDRI